MKRTSISFLYVTMPDLASAETLGRQLVEERHVACANIVPQMVSFYWWKDKLERGEEAVLLLKLPSSAVAKVRSRIESLHPYETVCMAEIKLESLNDSYLRWLLSSRSQG